MRWFQIVLLLALCLTSCSESVSRISMEICGNGIDDDGDGFTDDTDIDCGEFIAPAGGVRYSGKFKLTSTNFEWEDELLFATNPDLDFIFMLNQTGYLETTAATRIDGGNAWTFPAEDDFNMYFSEVDSTGYHLSGASTSGIELRLIDMDTIFTMTFNDVTVGSSDLPELAGETFPLEDIQITTVEPFARP